MILVIGATGTTGSAVVDELRRRGVPFRALTQRVAAAQELAARDIDVVVGDIRQPETLTAAFAGVERLYLATPSGSPDQGEIECRLLDAAHRAGVRSVVKISVLAADSQSFDRFYRIHGEVEEYLGQLGLAATILRPNNFMQNLARVNLPTILGDSALYVAAGEARISFVDVRDIAAVAAEALLNDAHNGQVYELTGPEALTYGEVAAQLSSRLGREIRYVALADAAARQGMLGAGLSPWYADGLIELYASYRRGEGAVVTETIRHVSGQMPRSLADYLDAHLGLFQG
jgi:uncharacterized protein YbjT (DUF2867 family)